MKIIDKNADDQVSFLEFQNMVEGHVLDHSIAGVYFVIVTLSEAEAIRAALHHEKRLHGLTKKDDDGKYSKRREDKDRLKNIQSIIAIACCHSVLITRSLNCQ